MAGLASRSRGAADDAALARRAAAGDGDAFAELYERHESRAFNLCYRILGSRDDAADATQEAFLGVLRRLPQVADRDLAFGSYVLTSARNACYDLIAGRKRARPSDEIPESAIPVGGGVDGGGVGFDPGDPEDDPERNMLLEARTEEIRAANLTLPARQREVLALRELEELSYDEIAELMDMNRNSVAQLISRARINLRDALRGTALASITPSTPGCGRSLELIALEQDGQLDEDSNDAGWLGEHLMHCHTCRLARDAMQEAGVSYRAWAPIAAGPLVFRETIARAAAQVGADWSETIARREARRSAGRGGAAAAAVGAGSGTARAAILRHRRLDLTLIGLLTCLLVLVVLVGAASDDDPVGTVVPAAQEEPAVAAADAAGSGAANKAADKKRKRRRAEASAPTPVPEPVVPAAVPVPVAEPEPAEPEARPKRRQPRRRAQVDRRGDRGNQGGLVPEVTPEPPPEPAETIPTPPPPPPTETTPTDPPRQQPPPPSCVPSPNCPRPPP